MIGHVDGLFAKITNIYTDCCFQLIDFSLGYVSTPIPQLLNHCN
jgi:hypothetical protein